MNDGLGLIVGAVRSNSLRQLRVESWRRYRFLSQSVRAQPPHIDQHTLFALSGLVISMSGDCTSNASPFSAGSGDLVALESCASSSISVLSVPLESVGEGSICWGYGLGGASVSEGPEDLNIA